MHGAVPDTEKNPTGQESTEGIEQLTDPENDVNDAPQEKQVKDPAVG